MTFRKQKMGKQYKRINGFRLPKFQSYHCSKNKVNYFRSKQPIKKIPSFSVRENRINTIESPYIQSLQEADVYLDASQTKAVVHPNGALACYLPERGVEKRGFLTARTAYLISEQKIEPNRIMLVTFTAKAANEMKSIAKLSRK